ncbi:Hypothetical predicted protein [Mytilus galloprovincialis]|uniref:PHD-type domain-containing protein n=1 Tax=Mytilus galloprovincialis TaxID=29158 RepID=A0A8B6EAH0_MYTGA|nr:Hypothetical predicted protein [Mytilus galloprovincialis]
MAVTTKTPDTNTSNKVIDHIHDSDTITKCYSLNIEKALKKKFDATKRTEISYEITGGGLTTELDAISFELLLFACKTLYNDMSNVRTDISKDKGGNIVQYTFMVKDSINEGYTINLYTTRCSMLVNGKKTNYFIHKDLVKIHSIMRKTNLNGLKIDKDNLNKLLADKLEHILSNEEANNTTSVDSNSVRCLKCNRNCKTRAVQCTNGHWVHYSCEKLSLKEIQNLPHIDYCCKTCSKQPSTVPYAITAAEALLREETIDDENCLVCNDVMTNDKQACPTCNHISHNKCFNINSDQCYSCHAIEEQRILSENQTQVENETKINKVTDHQTDAKTTYAMNGLQHTTPTACDKVNNTPQIIISEKEQKQQNKQKELKQQELKLKKREEQLRLKEAVVNDQSKDKTRLYDMIYKLEARNNELEKTVKSLYHKINNEDNTMNSNNETRESDRSSSNSTRSNNDSLANAIKEKVSGYILRKVDKEIDHLIRLEENVNNTPAEAYNYGYHGYPSTPAHSQQDIYYSSQQQNYHYPYYQHDNWSYNHHYYPDCNEYQYSNNSNLITVQLQQETGNIDIERNHSQQQNERINKNKLKTTQNFPHDHNIHTTRHSETAQYSFTGLNKCDTTLTEHAEGQPIYYSDHSRNQKTNSEHFLYQKGLRQPPF